MRQTLPAQAARWPLLASALATAWPGMAVSGDLFYGAQAGLFNDDNVPGAQAPGDIAGDAGWSVDANIGQRYAIREHDSLALAANFRTRQYQRFHALNQLALGGSLTYGTKFGLGAYVPRLSAGMSVSAESFGISLRDGWRSSLSLQLARRLTPRWNISGGYTLERFDASDVLPASPRFSRDAFSIQGHALHVRAEYSWSDNWLGFATAGARRGDIVSSTRPEPRIFALSSAIVADPAFGPDYFAYKLSARTYSTAVGASYALSAQSSLNFGLSREDTRGEGGIRYVTTVGNASFVYSY